MQDNKLLAHEFPKKNIATGQSLAAATMGHLAYVAFCISSRRLQQGLIGRNIEEYQDHFACGFDAQMPDDARWNRKGNG
jgi:hypothetical protein